MSICEDDTPLGIHLIRARTMFYQRLQHSQEAPASPHPRQNHFQVPTQQGNFKNVPEMSASGLCAEARVCTETHCYLTHLTPHSADLGLVSVRSPPARSAMRAQGGPRPSAWRPGPGALAAVVVSRAPASPDKVRDLHICRLARCSTPGKSTFQGSQMMQERCTATV